MLTVSEAARLLRIDPAQLRRLAAAGRIPCYRLPSLGRFAHYRFDLDEILVATRIVPEAPRLRIARAA